MHHALFFLDVSAEARRLEAATPEPGYRCFGGPRIVPAGGRAPSATPEELPARMAHVIDKGTDLVVQTHYHPSGKPESRRGCVSG